MWYEVDKYVNIKAKINVKKENYEYGKTQLTPKSN
jgi:hypothetical protein